MQRNVRLQLNDLFSLYFQESTEFFITSKNLSKPALKRQRNNWSTTEALVGFHLQGFIQEVFFEYQNKRQVLSLASL